MRGALYLAEARNKMLYELRPDLIPEGWLTDLELALWILHSESKANKHG